MSGEHTYWPCMLDRMTVDQVQLPNSPIYVPKDSDETMPLSGIAIDGALNPVPLCDLDKPMLKQVMAENCALVSYIPTRTYFTKRVHIKCRGCPTLRGCSMVCVGKNIANGSQKKTNLSPSCARCARTVPTRPQGDHDACSKVDRYGHHN